MTASGNTFAPLRWVLLTALFLAHGCGSKGDNSAVAPDADALDARDGADGGQLEAGVFDGGEVFDGGVGDDRGIDGGGPDGLDGGSGDVDAEDAGALDAASSDAVPADAVPADAVPADAVPADAGPPFVQREALQVRLAAASTLTPSLLVPAGADLLLVGTISTSGGRGLFVVRLDGNYVVRWSQRYAVSGYATATRAIVVGDTLVIVGAVQDSSGGTVNGSILAVSATDGTVRWARSVGDGRETLGDVVSIDGGALAVVGSSRSYNLESGVIERPFVAVLDASGALVWARSVYRALRGGRGMAIARSGASDLTIAVQNDSAGGNVQLFTIATSGPIRRGWELTGVVGDPVALDTSSGTLSLVASYTVASGSSYARSTTYTEMDVTTGTVSRAWGAYGTTWGGGFSASRVAFAQQTNPRNADLAVFDRSGTLVGGRTLAPGGATSSADAFLAAVIHGSGVRGVARINTDLWLVRSPLLSSPDGCVISSTAPSSLASAPSLSALTAYSLVASPTSVAATVTASVLPVTRSDECPP